MTASLFVASTLSLLVGTTARAQSLHTPTRSAQTPAGLAVSDYSGRNVAILNAVTLAVEHTLAIDGQPFGLAWFNGRLCVANQTTGGIETFEPVQQRGPSAKSSWKKRKNFGQKSMIINTPSDMAADEATGLLFVVSEVDQVVRVFDLAEKLVRSIGAPGATTPDGLLIPKGVALDPIFQRVFVTDYGDPGGSIFGGPNAPARVQIYSYDGLHLGSISGSSGQVGYQFSRPQGLALDGAGRLFVADSFLSQVLVFAEGVGGWAGVATLGTKGRAPGQLLLPMDVSIGPDRSDIFVTNQMNGRVERFGLGDLVP